MSAKLDRLVKEKQMCLYALKNCRDELTKDPLNYKIMINIRMLEDRIKKIKAKLRAYV